MIKRQKEIRILGIGLMLFSLFFTSYKYFKDSIDETSYIMGLLFTVIGMFLAQYGSNKKN